MLFSALPLYVVYGPCLLEGDKYRIQLKKNHCVRLIGGVRGKDQGI